MNTVTIAIEGSGSGVYLLRKKGLVVYVGMSRYILGRIGNHSSKRKFFDSVEIVWCHQSKAASLERRLIKKHEPIHNKTHNPACSGSSSFSDGSFRPNEENIKILLETQKRVKAMGMKISLNALANFSMNHDGHNSLRNFPN